MPIDVAEVERLVFHAVVHLEQIRAGLNWLGLDPDAVPPWRFDYLLSQSRYYAEKADSLQQRAMSLLQAAENTALTAQQAADTVSLTAAGVEVAKAQESLAYGQLEAASAAAEAAALAAQHTKDDVGWAGGVLAATAAGAAVGAAAGAAAGGIGAVFGAVIGAGTALISAAASTDRAVEARREAEAQVEIAEAQLSVAENQVALASEQVTLAEIQAAQAAAYLALLNAHELSSSAYYELLNIVGSFSQSYLTMATRLAFLAEKAHQIESRGYTSFISLGYGAQDSLRGRFQSGTRLLTDLDALEHARITSTVERYQTLKTTFSLLAHMPGALHLLRQTGQTVFRLDPQTLDLRFPGLYLHSLKGIEIAFDGLIPVGGVQAIVRSANNGFVRVPNDLAYIASPSLAELDWPYPEATHAIAPAAGKIQAPFVMKPLLGVGFRQILSEYRRAQDAVVVAAPEGSLGVSESLPMDLLFTVELPPTSNGFPYQNLGDARITLYFTAQFSDRLEADQRAALVAAGRVSQATVLLATAHAADSFAAFRATPLDPKRRDVRLLTLEASADRFPAHLKERVLGNFQLALIGMSGASMKVRFAGGALPITPTVDTSLASEDLPAGVPAHVPDGMVFTALGEVDQVIDGVTVYASRAGTYPALEALMDEVDDPTVAANLDNVVDTYVLKILPDNNPDHCVRDDAGVIVDTAATEASIAADGTLRHPGGEWLDVEARVLVTLAEGAFELVLRHNDPGAHNVAARLMITLSGSDLELRATIHHGATADEIAGINLPALQVLDPVYEVKLRVVGLTAQLYIDGVPLTLVQGGERVRTVALPASAPAAGSVQLGASGNAVPLLVSNVTVTRLRYDGTRLETVLDDPFDTLDGWTTAGGITLANADHRTLDVSHLLDVLLQLDYTAAFDFPV